MRNIVLVSGGFDPLHSGHIAYINAARKLGDVLVVGLNSDAWLTRKKGKYFLPYSERECIIENISAVDFVVQFKKLFSPPVKQIILWGVAVTQLALWSLQIPEWSHQQL